MNWRALPVLLPALLVGCGGATMSDAGDEGGGSGGSTNLGGAPGAGGTSAGGTSTGGSSTGGSSASTGGTTGNGGSLFEPDHEADVCFELDSVPACEEEVDDSYYEGPLVLATAEDIAPGGRFVWLGERAALLEVEGAELAERYWVVSASPTDITTAFHVSWPNAEGQWRILDAIGEGNIVFEYPKYMTAAALGCDEVGCRLFGTDIRAGDLLPLDGWSLPVGAQVERLTIEPGDDRLCAFGRDLYCIGDGGWEFVLTADEFGAARFTQVSYGLVQADLAEVRLGAAVTDTGVILVQQSSGEWLPVRQAVAGDTVVAFERRDDRLSVLYESGLWVPDVLADALAVCSLGSDAVWAAPFGELSVVVDRNGDGYWLTSVGESSWCKPFDIALPDTFDWGLSGCGLDAWPYAVSGSELVSAIGDVGCGSIK